MAIQMTRAEYEAKYGVKPITPGSSSASNSVSQPKTPISNKIANFIGAKGITDQFGSSIARAKAPEEQKDFVEFPKLKEVVGSAIQTGANLLPGAGKGAGLAVKAAIGSGTGYSYDVGSKMQDGKSPIEVATPGFATGVGVALPLGGAGIKIGGSLVGRLLKGLGSGLSGVSTKTIDSIVSNPEIARKATEKLAKNGNSKLLEENAREIINGVSKVKKEARNSFGQSLNTLKKEDIDPKKFRSSVQPFLEKVGSRLDTKTNTRLLDVEFSEPKNIEKASMLIDKLSKTDLDGSSLRKLVDEIESTRYRTATSDERLSFNAFTKELAQSVKDAISGSTNKLDEMNQKFSKDMQLAEAVENIFGKVNYRNLPEVVKASQKLETLFAQKGLAPDVVDDFLKRIGVSPEDFRTTEAVRQISDKVSGTNAKGLSFGEMAQQVTSAVITPKLVRDVATFTGLAEKTASKLLNVLSPAAKKVLLNAVTQSQESP